MQAKDIERHLAQLGQEERCAMSTTFGTLQTMTQVYQQICGGGRAMDCIGQLSECVVWLCQRQAGRISE